MSFDAWLSKTKPVMPVIVVDRVQDAVPLANALLAGGVHFMEVTLRTDAALDAIREIRQHVPQAIVGVGTVTEPADLDRAQQAGAQFAISPGITDALCEQAKTLKLPFLPGVMTPSDILLGMAHGFQGFKFYPATAAGGVDMLKAFAGPFSAAWFCPTGGIDASNADQFLQLSNVPMVGGSWVCPTNLVRKRDWRAIEQLALGFNGH